MIDPLSSNSQFKLIFFSFNYCHPNQSLLDIKTIPIHKNLKQEFWGQRGLVIYTGPNLALMHPLEEKDERETST